MTKDVKYYRDIQPGETLQAGDERLIPSTDLQRQEWQPENPVFYGGVVSRYYLSQYRRPVDAVPREEHERLQDVLAEVRYLHGHAMHDRDTMQEELAALQSQPRLQPVTPEAIKDLEADEMVTVVCVSQDRAKTMTWLPAMRQWHSKAGHDNPLEWQWFFDLSRTPEVHQ